MSFNFPTLSFDELFSLKHPSVTVLKCLIIKDRRYEIPTFFYDYVDEDVVLQLISWMSQSLKSDNDKNVNNYNNFTNFIRHAKQSDFNYKYIITSLIDTNCEEIPTLKYLYLFNDSRIKKILNKLIHGISIDDIISIMEGFCDNNVYVPEYLVRLFLRKKLGYSWLTKSSGDIANELYKLYKSFNNKHMKYVFPAIHCIVPDYFEYNTYLHMDYKTYWNQGNDYLPTYVGLVDIVSFLQSYVDNNRDYEISSSLMGLCHHAYDHGYGVPEDDEVLASVLCHMRKLILETCKNNANNIKLVYWKLGDLTKITSYFNTAKIPLRDYKYIEKVAVKTLNDKNRVELHYCDDFIKRGGDPNTLPYNVYSQLQPYMLDYILAYSDVEDIKRFLCNSDVVIKNSSIEPVRYITSNMSKFHDINKIYDILLSEPVIQNISIDTRHKLLKDKDIVTLLRAYPHLYRYFSDAVTKSQLNQLYGKCDIIKYIPYSHLDNRDRFNYVYTYGYTDFTKHQDPITALWYFTTQDIKNLNNIGIGFGYLIDGNNWLSQASLIRSALIELN